MNKIMSQGHRNILVTVTDTTVPVNKPYIS